MRSRRYGARRQRSRSLFWVFLGLIGLGGFAIFRTMLREERRLSVFGGDDEEPLGPPEDSDEDAPSAALESETIWIAGPAGNLYVRYEGENEDRLPVLFLHSLAGNGGQWALQLDDLRGNRRAVAFDFRGHGDSDPADDGDYSIAGLCGDVTAVADQLGLRRFVLVGHSLGSAVAIEYASRHPERVAGLLLVDPNGDQSRVPTEQVASFLEALRDDPLRELESYFRQLVVSADPDAARWVLEDLRLTHEDAIPAALEDSMRYQPLPALARYTGPRLSIISDMNSLPYSLHNLLPDLPVRLMTGTGHWVMMDRPEAFNRLLEGFLKEVEEQH